MRVIVLFIHPTIYHLAFFHMLVDINNCLIVWDHTSNNQQSCWINLGVEGWLPWNVIAHEPPSGPWMMVSLSTGLRYCRIDQEWPYHCSVSNDIDVRIVCLGPMRRTSTHQQWSSTLTTISSSPTQSITQPTNPPTRPIHIHHHLQPQHLQPQRIQPFPIIFYFNQINMDIIDGRDYVLLSFPGDIHLSSTDPLEPSPWLSHAYWWLTCHIIMTRPIFNKHGIWLSGWWGLVVFTSYRHDGIRIAF